MSSIVLIGEIGGTTKEDAAALIKVSDNFVIVVSITKYYFPLGCKLYYDALVYVME